MLKCQHMPDFGGEDANAVKKSFEEAFLKTFELPQDIFSDRMVSICTDGASVNMGKYNGACTQLKTTRDWLLVIHCANHRLELAMKDAFKADGSFTDIDDLMTQIYYLFRNSGKAKRMVTTLAHDILGVTFLNFVRASGTRFQNHKYNAIRTMIVNFLPLCLYMENIVENPRESRTENVAKMRGYLNRFLSYKYLASLHLYRKVLEQTAHLSYVLQNPSVLITDVIEALSQTKQKVGEIAESAVDLPFPATEQQDGTLILTAKGTNLPASLSSKEKHSLSEKQKQQVARCTNVTRQEYKIRNVPAGKAAVTKIKDKLIPAICSEIDERFSSFLSQDEIFQSVQVVDHTCWDYDDKDYGIDKIRKLCQHFVIPLGKHQFNEDSACYEFRNLKKLVGEKYRNQKNKMNVWRQLFTHYSDRFPHILLLVELCLCMSISSSTVERGFSAAGRVLVDSRLSIKKQTLDDLLLIRVNITGMRKLDKDYDDKLVQKAIDMYLASSKRQRYHQTKKSVQGSSLAGPSKLDEAQHTSSDDTFLPNPFRPPVNPLLGDALFPVEIGDSDDDSSGDDDDDNDSDSGAESDIILE